MTPLTVIMLYFLPRLFFDLSFIRLGETPLCNGRADRGIFIFGFCLPLCYRCSFIIIGIFSGLIFFKFIKTDKITYKSLYIITAVLLIVPTALDGVIQFLTASYESHNVIRAVTGFFAGFGVDMLINFAFPA